MHESSGKAVSNAVIAFSLCSSTPSRGCALVAMARAVAVATAPACCNSSVCISWLSCFSAAAIQNNYEINHSNIEQGDSLAPLQAFTACTYADQLTSSCALARRYPHSD
jgi:hypothetical protein